MISNATISETAKSLSKSYWLGPKRTADTAVEYGFKNGINWLLGNIWHDGSDSPFYGKKCLVELTDENDAKYYAVAAEYQGGGWDRSVSDLVVYDDCRISRWLYIDDLLRQPVQGTQTSR